MAEAGQILGKLRRNIIDMVHVGFLLRALLRFVFCLDHF